MDMKKYRHKIQFLILVAILFLLWYSGRYLHIDTAYIQRSLEGFPLFFSALLFIVLYVGVTFFVFFSKDIFWITAALIFGPIYSALFIFIAEAINAFILFHLARYLGRTYVAKSLTEKYKTLDERLGRISFFWLFVFRAAPLIPYRFLDLAAGLTRINFPRYFTAVILGSWVKIFWIQYILFGVGESALRNPLCLADYFLNNSRLLMLSFVYVILVIMAFFKIKKIRE
jgi:uncharacterized membrane protein YdjX (TVP38/TMEM64 family)